MQDIKTEIKDIVRFNKIVATLLEVGFVNFLSKLKLRTANVLNIKTRQKYRSLSTPERLRIAFEKLGPTFIKFGQLLSVRPDLMPKEYVEEFSKLQDNVPAFDPDEARAIVEYELNAPVSKILKSFSTKPLSAASIAQVHRAVLKDGREVVVKIQRPNIDKMIRSDIHILYYLAKLIDKHIPGSKPYNPRDMVDEFSKWIVNELDFMIEARNAERLRENFRRDRRVIIPKIYWKYCTKRTLVMDYIEGERLDNIQLPGSKKKLLLQNMVDIFLKQVMVDGFFHADPHPGNIFIVNNEKIALVDFGIVGSLDNYLREQIANIIIAFTDKDIEALMDIILNMNILDRKVNMKQLRTELRSQLDVWYVTGNINYAAKDLVSINRIAYENNIKLPLDFILLSKLVLTLDGVGKLLDKNYNFMQLAIPYIDKFEGEKRSLQYMTDKLTSHGRTILRTLDRLPLQVSNALRVLERGKIELEIEPKELREVKELTNELERTGEKIALAFVIGAIVIGASLLAQVQNLPVVMGMPLSNIIFIISALFGVWLVLSIIRQRR